MPLATEQQKATWRVQRAARAGKEPAAADIAILGQEEVDKVVGAVKVAMQGPAQQPQQKSQPQVQQGVPVTPLELPEFRPQVVQPTSNGQASDTKETDGYATKVKRVSPREKAFTEFYHDKFGPLLILLLFIAMRDWQRATFYAFSPKEMHDLSGPLARITIKILDLIKPPQWVEDAIMVSDDVITVGYVMTSYLERTGILDKIMPWFSETTKELKEKYDESKQTGRQAAPNNVGPPAIIQNPVGRGDQPVGLTPEQLAGIGAQWAAS